MARPRNNPGDLAELPTELRTDRPKGDQIREILENLTRSLAVGTVLTPLLVLLSLELGQLGLLGGRDRRRQLAELRVYRLEALLGSRST